MSERGKLIRETRLLATLVQEDAVFYAGLSDARLNAAVQLIEHSRQLCDALEEAERERERLHTLCQNLLSEYDKEEEEHGFPFNFALREAHRQLRQAMAEPERGTR